VTTVYVPRDSAALSVGAEEVAGALAAAAQRRGSDVELVRNGSRGLLWLEPLVEVATPGGRVAYGPVTPGDVDGLVDAGMLEGGAHRLRLGPTEEIPWLARQTRYTFSRAGITDPLSPGDYEAHGGLLGMRKALTMEPPDIVATVTESGLRGRGGAGFPCGVKWATVLAASTPDVKFVCANADEGDSGTFADRILMESDPFSVIEGIVIAGLGTGASEGLVFIRSEYPLSVATMRTAVEIAYLEGWLGTSILGSGRRFDLSVRVGAGSYICGEETAMLEALEGRRGVVRAKPPLPAHAGLFGRPTAINNVLTLASVPRILTEGPETYSAMGTGRSRGTQVFQLAGNVAHGGIVELPFGISLAELVYDFGGGTRSGRPVRAVQVGGPLGTYLPASELGIQMDYEAFAAAGATVGHGGVVVFDDTLDMARQARFAMELCAEESCGKCTPCRVGAVRGVEVIDRIVAGENPEANLELLEDLCELMASASLCAMGSLTPVPVRSALAHFRGDFHVPGDGNKPGDGDNHQHRPYREATP